jgi:adenylate cyclase
MNDLLFGTTKSFQESLEKAIEITQKALAVNEDHPDGHAMLGYLYCYKREYDKAIAEGERAVTLNPGGAMAHSMYGLILTYAGRPEEAIPLLRKAVRLNPFGPSWYYLYLGHAYRDTGQFEEAVATYKRALLTSPNNIVAHVNLTAIYSMMGREKEARAEAGEVLRVNPKFSLDYWAKAISVYKDKSAIDNVIGALRKAGLK